MKLKECKIGMTVKAIKKSIGLYYWKEFCENCPTHTAVISSVIDSHVTLRSSNDYRYIFLPEDLELIEDLRPIKEETKMEYKELQKISVKLVGDEKPCKNEFTLFANHFLPNYYSFEFIPLEEVIKTFKDHETWKSWLILHNFIKEIEKEKTFSVGDEFILNTHAYSDTKAVLIEVRKNELFNILILSGPDKGRVWSSNHTKCENMRKITETEIKNSSYSKEVVNSILNSKRGNE